MPITTSHNADVARDRSAPQVGRWWTPFLRGLAAICFGMLAIVWPALTLFTFVVFYGAFALIDGLLAIFSGLIGRTKSADTWLSVAMGFLGVAAGVLSLTWPRFVVIGLVLYAGIWAVLRGFADVVAVIRSRGGAAEHWSLLVSGLLSVILGVLVLAAPRLGLVVVVWSIAACSIAMGTLLVAYALHLRARPTGAVGTAHLPM